MARHYPDIIDEMNRKTYLRWCIATLTTQLFQAQKAEAALVTGAVRGLHDFLIRFNNLIEQSTLFLVTERVVRVTAYALIGPSDIESLYKCLKDLLQIPDDLNRYSSPLAAMDFLVDHFLMFQQYLVEDCKFLYTQLLSLSNHTNRDMAKAGIYAVHKFLDVVSMVLAKSSSGDAEKKTFAVGKAT